MVIETTDGLRNARVTVDTVRKAKPLTSRLRKSKNFWKEDRSLDDYIDRNEQLKAGEKLLLKKLIKLRRNEDSNEVVVTKSGLGKLLNVNIKTIRDWINKLIRKGFLFDEGEVWIAHCNYPRHKYSFPVTFPGFDSATVFIRRGAKAKFKAKLATQKTAEKQGKNSCVVPKITCPVVPRLIDCSNSSPTVEEIETRNSFPETKVSAKEISLSLARSAPQPRARKRTLISHWKPKRIAGTKQPFLSVAPGLKSLLQGVLTSIGVKGKIRHISNYLDKLIHLNGSFRNREDLLDLAENLAEDIHTGWVEEAQARNALPRLFKFLRAYILQYSPASRFQTEEYYALKKRNFRMIECEDKFFKEFPFCRPEGGWRMRAD